VAEAWSPKLSPPGSGLACFVRTRAGYHICVIHRTPLPAEIRGRLVNLADVLEPFEEIAFAYLFGGAATGRLAPFSDVDIGIFVDRGEPSAVTSRVFAAVTHYLRTDEVDLVLLNTAPIALAGRVLLSRQVILDRQPFVRHRFESVTARQFLDFRKFEHRLLARRFADGRP